MNKEAQVSFSRAIVILAGLIVIGFAIEKIGGIPAILKIFTRGEISTRLSFIVVFVSIVAIVISYRHLLVKILASTRFAVTLLFAIALFTILGTLIIQDERYETYLKVYGKNITEWIFKLNLTNIFHSYYFGILLGTLTVSLILVTIRRKPFKLTQLGFTFAHTGTVLILVGGLIGVIWGEKGYLHLIKGQPTNVMKVVEKGRETGEKKLDFSVSLEDFKVEYYDEGDRIAVYKREGDAYKYMFSINPSRIKEFQLPGGIRTIRILNKKVYVTEEKTEIPYFEIEVDIPEHIRNSSGDESSNFPHHGIGVGGFKDGPVSLILAQGNPLPFAGNKYIVDYVGEKEPRLFQSILSITTINGQKIVSPPILVNSPFSYGGYKFYQSNYNPDNPYYSGILVVKDPGLPLVYIGFVFICAGIIYIFYIKPKIIAAIRSQDEVEGASVNLLTQLAQKV